MIKKITLFSYINIIFNCLIKKRKETKITQNKEKKKEKGQKEKRKEKPLKEKKPF